MTKTFGVFLILTLLVALVFSMCDFCRTSAGTQCGRSDESTRGQEEAVSLSSDMHDNEDEEVLYEAITLGKGGKKGEASWNDGKGKGKGPHDLAKLTNPYECVGACDWIRMDKFVCDTCTYPYAFYNKTQGYMGTQCVTENNKWALLKNEPAKAEAMVEACKVRADCICRIPTERCTFTCRDYYLSLCNSHLREYGGSNSDSMSSSATIIVENQLAKCAAFTIKKLLAEHNGGRNSHGKGGSKNNKRDLEEEVLSNGNGNGNSAEKAEEKQFKFMQEVAFNVTLSLNGKELNYWCPSVTANSGSSQGKSHKGGNPFGSGSSRRPNVKYAPREVVVAIDSFCQYKMDNIIKAVTAATPAAAAPVTPAPTA